MAKKKPKKKHGNSVSGKDFVEANPFTPPADAPVKRYLTAGQPTKYHPDFCEMLVKHMGKGFPYETFAADIDVCRDTLYMWEKAHKQFADAKKRGRARQYQALFALGMAGMTGRITFTSNETTHTRHTKDGTPSSATVSVHKGNGFSTGAWAMMMKNCAGWRNEPELNDDDQVDTMDFDGAPEEKK